MASQAGFDGVFLLEACRRRAVYSPIPPARCVSSQGNNSFGFDSGDRSGFCRMIITTGTEAPTRCYHTQALLRLEGFPHNTSAQTFKAARCTDTDSISASQQKPAAPSNTPDLALFTTEAINPSVPFKIPQRLQIVRFRLVY